MTKAITEKPVFILLYGFPGSGKSYFARQLTESLQIALVSGDRLRHELFEHPRYDKRENDIVEHLMIYMAEEYLNCGLSVIFDTNASSILQRRLLRDMARKAHAEPLLVWFQIDPESAFARASKRDRRKAEDKYSTPYDKPKFEEYIKQMQNPKNEDYVVVSGKHTFNTQRSAVFKRLYEAGLISAETAGSYVVKPGLVNLVPNPTSGRVDISRRNIVIR